jgi:hypothetical protein
MQSGLLLLLLNFIQGISWPIVACIIIYYFGSTVKNILNTMQEVMKERGVKITSPAGGELEVPEKLTEIQKTKKYKK